MCIMDFGVNCPFNMSYSSINQGIYRYSSQNACYVSESASQSTFRGNVLFLPVSRDTPGVVHALGGREGGSGISPVQILLAKFPEAHGGKCQPRLASHAERVFFFFLSLTVMKL